MMKWIEKLIWYNSPSNLLYNRIGRFRGDCGKVGGMDKEKAMKPVERIEKYLKYGFVIVEHQYMDCPRCSATLNAGPCYQPKYCDQCGQKLNFLGIEWKKEQELGFAKEAI